MRILIVIISLLLSLHASAQKQVETQQQVWFRYFLKVPAGEKWQFRQEIDDRNFYNPFRQHTFVSRTHIERKLGKGWNIALGFAYFDQATPQDPDVEDYTNVLELRPSFEFAYRHQLTDQITVLHRNWNELRYFPQQDGHYEFGNFRFRYKLEFHYSVSDFLDLYAFDEIFINVGKKIVYNTFDQNRYGVGAQFSIMKDLDFELSYINWFQQRSEGHAYYTRHIIRLALNQTIVIKKRDSKEEHF